GSRTIAVTLWPRLSASCSKAEPTKPVAPNRAIFRDTFEKRHSKDTTVFWPGQAVPTRGRDNHKAESIEFFKTFPDNHLINHPYKVEIAQGEWTCTVADFTGTMRGPMKGSEGKVIAPTNKKFHIEFCTVAHWKNAEIVEEKLFYDLVGLLKQIGVACFAFSPVDHLLNDGSVVVIEEPA